MTTELADFAKFLKDDLNDLPSTFALRYPSPQAAWSHGVRQSAPLSDADTVALRRKMAAAYAAWTGRSLHTDLHSDRFPPDPPTP